MHRVLIAGCGYVGKKAAALFIEAGWEVTGVVRSLESAHRLNDPCSPRFQATACNISDPAEVERKLGRFNGIDLVIHCAASSHGGAEEYRSVYLEGARNLLSLRPSKFIFTSSTSVYAQNDGSLVTEESPAQPERETGRILRETEKLVLGYRGGIVARLAGIYGPNRAMILRKFLDGSAVLEGDGGRFLNQIHRDDAASALLFLGGKLPETLGSPALFNVCDTTLLTQLDCYRWLAEHFHRPLPPYGPVDTERKRGATNKRVSNAKLTGLGWQPRYNSFTQALLEDKDLLPD